MTEPDWDEGPVPEPDWAYDPPPPQVDWDEAVPSAAVAPDGRSGVSEIRERHPKAYDPWTPAAEAELVAAYLAGRSVEQLAMDFERQPSAILRRLEKVAFAEMTKRRSIPPGTGPG